MSAPIKVTFDRTAEPHDVNTLLRVGPNELLACRVHKMSDANLRQTIWRMQSVIDTLLDRMSRLEGALNEHFEAGCSIEGDVIPNPD